MFPFRQFPTPPLSTRRRNNEAPPQIVRTRQGRSPSGKGPRERTGQGYRLEKSTEAQPMNPRHIQYSKATCEIRDRLWKYTSARFRCLNRNPRNPEALLQHLYKTQEALKKAEIEAQQPIDVEGIKTTNEAANEAILKSKPHLANQPWRLWKTDPKEIEKQEREGRRYLLQRLQHEIEPYRAASVPLYEKDYQPRYWEKLTLAGLVHDHRLCCLTTALSILEAKTMTAKP